MNEQIVNTIKNVISSQAKKVNHLRKEYEALKAMEPKNIKAQNEIAIKAQTQYDVYESAKNDLKKYEKLHNEYVNLLATVAIENDSDKVSSIEKSLEEKSEELEAFENELIDRYDITLETDHIDEEEKDKSVDEAVEYKTSKPNKNIAKNIIAGVLVFVTAFTLGYGVKGCSNSKYDREGSSIVERVDNTENVGNKNPGEYGTFTDITDEEQINERANYIYSEYFETFKDKLTPSEQEMITPEKIANIIRVVNGELPLDENGYKYYDANLTDDYIQALTKITADLPSSPALDKIYHIPTHLFAVDGTKLSDFMKKYDEDYANIAEARNNRDGEKAQEAIASLGKKLWYEWSLQGMNYEIDEKMTDYQSPFDLPASQRALALNAAVAKYGPYVFEYNLNAMQPVCIDACVDYYTKTMQKLTVNEIFVGVTSGEYDTVIAKAAGIDVDKEPDSIAFDQDLKDQLEFKYRKLNQKTLK